MVLVTAVSGFLIAHTGSPDAAAERPPSVRGSGSLRDVLPINDLLIAALKSVQDRPVRIMTEEGGIRRARGPAAIERALFRPASGTVQVLFRDGVPLEVVLDWSTAQALSVAPRHELRWSRLHNGSSLGTEESTRPADAVAVLIVLMSVTGIWIWWRDRARADLDRAGRLHRRAGLAASIVLLFPAVTGVLLNHRVDLGFNYSSALEIEAEQIVKLTPARLDAIAEAAVKALAAQIPGTAVDAITALEYFPVRGHVAVRFRDRHEVEVNTYNREVEAIVPPRGTWVRELHSGRYFGAAGPVVISLIAMLWIVVSAGGLHLMIRARWREGSPS